jgi:AraC-like DNA-binding protein
MMVPELMLMWPVDARPRIRVAGQFPLEAAGFPFSYRSQTHALHLHGYAGTIRIAGRSFALAPGTLTLSPAGHDSSYDLPEPGVHWCIHFYPQPRKGRQPAVGLPWVRPLGDLQIDAARRFAHVARLHTQARQGAGRVIHAALALALQELLLWIGLLDQTHPPADESPSHVAVDHVVRIVQQELDRPLRVPELARRVRMSQNYLARLFRRRMGVTLPHFILKRRVEAARLLLATTDLPVKQIGARVGMPDPQHFNKQFRRLTGVSPTAARRRG